MILRRMRYFEGDTERENYFTCSSCERNQSDDEQSVFRCAKGAFKHILDHFCSDQEEGYPKVVECACCWEKKSAAEAVNHFAECFQMICNACEVEKDKGEHIFLLKDLTLLGDCDCDVRYDEVKADWVLFDDFEDYGLHALYVYLHQRLDLEPSLNEKRKGVDQVERNYHELMDCRDADGMTFDEAIADCLIPDDEGVVNVECDCCYCYTGSDASEESEGLPDNPPPEPLGSLEDAS